MATIVQARAGAVPLGGPSRAFAYSWIVFALAFGLLISDYMARQVLNAVFPLLKAQWSLSDGQLGLLSGIVAIMVGLLTFPVSMLADRWGRVKSLTVMAVLWSVATLLCAVAQSYEQMLGARLLVGVGEAAYGSVGIALVISVFPRNMRATLSAAFMAGGLAGQVLGVALGGQIAASHGWRAAFLVIGLAGLLLALVFPLVVREKRIAALDDSNRAVADDLPSPPRPPLGSLFASRTIILAYIGSGLQLFCAGSLAAWLPTFFGRYYGMPVDRAGHTAAVLFLICGAGMILCGMTSDRLARHRPDRKIVLAIACCLSSATALFVAMQCPPGAVQLAILAIAMFLLQGSAGPVGAMVANLTPLAIHGTAFATLTLANNLLGFAPGPISTGWLADRVGLLGAFSLVPLVGILAALVFTLARRTYLADLAKMADGSPA
ncbi:multidrug DMT transporter permease [Sphingopyxis lindanitolerans]|uniref:Multidrug DMT transporter permease n=1 Tax=Sphingopyxis lindanitolerans TaxID=2054227 RepID=A0A2S8B116_9SPHN|nr:MFS transporter [Sphingopyxis lindanitolerans]PQM26056.1 multidrug DMT transporter permease [Sphingopyxis lindanitolerans]